MTPSRDEAISPGSGFLNRLAPRLRPLQPVHRAFLAIVGGYVVSATTATALTLTLAVSNILPRSEAVAMTTMFAYLVYLVAALWAFAERHPWRLWAVLGGLSLLSVAATEALTPILLARVAGS